MQAPASAINRPWSVRLATCLAATFGASVASASPTLLVDVASGKAIPLPSPADTPLVLPVPAGRYRVTVAEPAPGSARAEREVAAVAGAPALVALRLKPVEELLEDLR